MYAVNMCMYMAYIHSILGGLGKIPSLKTYWRKTFFKISDKSEHLTTKINVYIHVLVGTRKYHSILSPLLNYILISFNYKLNCKTLMLCIKCSPPAAVLFLNLPRRPFDLWKCVSVCVHVHVSSCEHVCVCLCMGVCASVYVCVCV